MRVRNVACSCLLVATSMGGAKTLAAASPDCARWIKEYQQGLARRAVLGKKHVVKAAQLIVPRPHLQQASAAPSRVRPPKLSPSEMLKRFKVLCGEDLPDEVLKAVFVPTGLEDTLISEVDTLGDDYIVAGQTGNGTPPSFSPVPPTDNGTQPNGTLSLTAPDSGGVANGGLPGTPTAQPTPITLSPVPEPDTFVLLLTGLGTIAGVLCMRGRLYRSRVSFCARSNAKFCS